MRTSFAKVFLGFPCVVLGLGALLGATACSGDSESPGDGEGGGGGAPAAPPKYAASSMVWDDSGTSTYVALLDDLDVERVTTAQAREFAGAADLWVHGDALFVADSVSLTITKFEVANGELTPADSDENGEPDEISFADYGLTDFGFWRNVFVADDKAYILSGTSQYVIWDPEAMVIVGTFDIPELPARDGLQPFPGYSDRAAIVRGHRLYQPIYYTDPDQAFFVMDGGSSLLVVDTEADEVEEVLELPCPGIDFASRDDDDNLYFSSWVFAPGGAAVIDQPATCVVQIAEGGEPEVLFDVADVTDGREGGMLRYLGDGKAFLSVLHDERSDSEDPSDVADGPNWKFWLYDLASGTATPSDALPFNAGAAYDCTPDGKPHILVPSGDYTTTQLFELHSDGSADAKFTATGWTLRLFDLP